MIERAALVGLCALAFGFASPPVSVPALFTVDFPAERIPRFHWERELVWLHNLGVRAITVNVATPDLRALASQAGLSIEQPAISARRLSVLKSGVLLEARHALFHRQPIEWSDVESEVAPAFRRGAVSLAGDEDASVLYLRREAEICRYWTPVLTNPDAKVSDSHPAEAITTEQRSTLEASALNVSNAGKELWHGDVRAALPSYGKSIQIPNVTVPAHEALLLPVDVAFADARFCRACTGMSNSERLLYATVELTAIEYENGILSFEFYAPVEGNVVLQLEREPAGPMLAGGRLVPFDWDAENKRARLTVPQGKGKNKHVRIAITMTSPDEVASFVDAHVLVIGQTNRILTDYSSEALAKRSRLIAPENWKVTSEVKSPTQIAYSIDVPANRLHGDHADLRLEADGVGMSHVRVQLLRPVSVHMAEAASVWFGTAAELVTDPPVIPVEAPGGRNLTVLLRNNAPEIRTFQVMVEGGEGVTFSPEKTEISLGASMEREVSVRVFDAHAAAGLHQAVVRVRGAAEYEQPIRLVVIPRDQTVTYSAELTGVAEEQSVWENAHILAIFSKPSGGRWISFYWKPSGVSLLPPEGVSIGDGALVTLQGDKLEIAGGANLPTGGRVGDLEWRATSAGTTTRFDVHESAVGRK